MAEPALIDAALVETPEAVDVKLLCLLPSIPLGGMERAAIRVIDRLMARGAQAHFVAEKRWGVDVQRHIERIGATWSGVPLVASLGRPRTLLELSWATRSFVRSPTDFRRVFEDYRPRQLLATNINSAFFARALARRDDVVSVVRVPNPPGRSASRPKRALDRAVWHAVYGAFDMLVCNSHYTAERLTELVGDDSKIDVVRNFPPTLDRGPIDDEPPLNPARRTIVFLGQISRHKGVDLLVEAAIELIAGRPDVDLVLAGPDVWTDPFGEKIRTRVRAAGLQERIRFLGTVDHVHTLLRVAAVHVCPSVGANESFPNVVIEAKQAGTPSVVFPIAGLPEAVETGVDGIVTPEPTVASLRDTLAQVLDDPVLRARLAEGATRSLAAFSEDRIAARWFEILDPARRRTNA